MAAVFLADTDIRSVSYDLCHCPFYASSTAVVTDIKRTNAFSDSTTRHRKSADRFSFKSK